jgi:hypothetical protein
MAASSINLIKDTTVQAINETLNVQNVILAAIAGQTGGLRFDNFKDIQQLVRLGLHKLIFHVGDQLIAEKETALTATVGHTGETGGITAAAVDADAFLAALGTAHSGEYEFSFNGAEWHFNGAPVFLATYGITITGSPIAGDEVIVHETTAEIAFDIVGIDQDTPADSNFIHSMTLMAHDVYIAAAFDAKEALFAFDDGLEAGTYHFTIDQHPWVAGDVGKVVQFTLTNDIPAGGQLVVNNAYNATMIGATISAFSGGTSVTAAETVTMTEGSDGTDLGSVASTLTGTTTNSIQRALLGSNNWSQSAARQYLNSDKAAGAYWTPKTKWDRPPGYVATTAGFLKGLDADFVSVLGKVVKTTSQNTVTDGGGGVQSEELIFLPSRSEIYGSAEISGVNEGEIYDFYKNATDADRIKYQSTAARFWVLRTPFASYASYVRIVTSSGVLGNYNANYADGLVPACCIV